MPDLLNIVLYPTRHLHASILHNYYHNHLPFRWSLARLLKYHHLLHGQTPKFVTPKRYYFQEYTSKYHLVQSLMTKLPSQQGVQAHITNIKQEINRLKDTQRRLDTTINNLEDILLDAQVTGCELRIEQEEKLIIAAQQNKGLIKR